MNGRSAVVLVVATVVIKLSNELLASGTIREPLFTEDYFSAFILMAFITTFVTPILLKWSIVRCRDSSEKESFRRLTDDGKNELKL